MLAGLLLLLFAQSDPGERAARAKDLMGSGRFAEAATIYGALAKEMPTVAGLWMNLGMAEHMAGRDAEAVRALEQALKLDPALPPSHLFLGLAYFRLGQLARAIAPLERFVAAVPDHQDARQALADALMMTRRWESAAAHFLRLAEINPASPRAFYGLGRAWEALAAGTYDLIPADSAWRDVLAGSARAGVRRFPEALALYRRALSRNARLRGVHAAIAEIYQETGHPDWAAAEQKRENAVPPADCKTERLECAFRGGRYRETIAAARPLKTAEAFYWTARSADELAAAAFARLEQLPASIELHEWTADSLRRRGRHQESAQSWREALKLAPGDRRLERELALALYRARAFEEASIRLSKMISAGDRAPEAFYYLGDALLNLQRAEQAAPNLEKAVAARPKEPAWRASLGRALSQIGEPARAIPHLEAARSIDEDGSVHFLLARALQSAGRLDEAKAAMAKFQELSRKREAEITPP